MGILNVSLPSLSKFPPPKALLPPKQDPSITHYGFNPRMGVEPTKPCAPNISDAQHKEFFRASEIADRFKAIVDMATALARQAQHRYEENANRHRDDAPKYRVGDKVFLDIQNY